METNLVKYLENFNIIDIYGIDNCTHIQQLLDVNVNLLSELKNFDIFKNVKKINVIDTPIYHGEKETGKPIKSLSNYLGETHKAFSVLTYNYNYHDPNFEFNEEIDLYSLSLSPKIYDMSILDCGVWKFPLQYDPQNFKPFDKIEIKYSLDEMMNINKYSLEEAKTNAKKTILDAVSLLIDQQDSNLPHTRTVLIRCSERSIKPIKITTK